MKKTLLVSSSGQSTAPLLELLKSEGFGPVTVTAAAFNARQETERTAFDLICINAPLADENGIDLSRHFAETTRAGVVMIVPQKNADEVNVMLTQYGVLVIAKPINRHLFHHFLQFTDCFRTRMLKMERENEALKSMVEDMRLVDRAKLLLVSYLNMTEAEAHRYLEKRAMDLRVSRVEVAKQVIQTYQT
ncbi:MAG: ANTAR domain-containing protein [Ruminococcus sp.]